MSNRFKPPNELASLEDAVRYTHRPERRRGLQDLLTQTHRAEANVQRWNERLTMCREELTQRRSEIVSQLDNLQTILGEIDRQRKA